MHLPHQGTAVYRPQRNADRCHKHCCLSSFSFTTACLPLCSLVSLAPWHSFNSTLLPILHIHSNIHRVHSHNYRFLLDVTVCLQSFPISAQHIIRCWTGRLGPYIVSNADHKHAHKTRFLIVLHQTRVSYFKDGEGGGASLSAGLRWATFNTSESVQAEEEWKEEACVRFQNQSRAIVQSVKVNSSLSCSNR